MTIQMKGVALGEGHSSDGGPGSIEVRELDWSPVMPGPRLYERVAACGAAIRNAGMAMAGAWLKGVVIIGWVLRNGMRSIKPALRKKRISLRSRLNDLVINGLTVISAGSALAALGLLVTAGASAYGAHYTLAGLFVWYALLAVAVTYVSYRVMMWLTLHLSMSEQPNLHANDLIS